MVQSKYRVKKSWTLSTFKFVCVPIWKKISYRVVLKAKKMQMKPWFWDTVQMDAWFLDQVQMIALRSSAIGYIICNNYHST